LNRRQNFFREGQTHHASGNFLVVTNDVPIEHLSFQAAMIFVDVAEMAILISNRELLELYAWCLIDDVMTWAEERIGSARGSRSLTVICDWRSGRR
jgi:hypothetical protein